MGTHGHPVRRTDEVQLDPVDAEGAPPHPRRSLETRRLLPDLPRVQHREQGRIDDHSVSGSPTSSSAATSRRRGSRKRRSFFTRRLKEEGWSPTTPGNRCEKNRRASRKNERSLSTPRSCWNKARVTISPSPRGALYGFVASRAVRVEMGVGIVYEAEEHAQSLFQVEERVGMLGLGHPRFLSPRVRMAPVVPSIHATHI